MSLALFGYNIPIINSGYGFVQSGPGATGGGYVSNQAGLTDRSPRGKCRIQWPTGTGQTTSTYVELYIPLGSSMRIRAIQLLSTTLPPGMLTVIYGTLSGVYSNLGGNTNNTLITTFADASVGCRYYTDPPSSPNNTTLIDTIIVRLYNSVNGVASVVAGTYFDIGEAVMSPGFQLDIEPNWKEDRITSSSKILRSLGGQVSTLVRPSYRRWTVRPRIGSTADLRSSGIESSTDFETFQAALANDPFCQIFQDISSSASAQASGSFAVCTKLPAIGKLAGPYYQFDPFEFEEIAN